MIEAYQKTNLIHRDISVGNIILVRESPDGPRKGYLIDWELACDASRESDSPRRAQRIVRLPPSCASRRFVLKFLCREHGNSCPLICSRLNLFSHSITDDMEALMYVVLFCGIRWLSHSLTDNAIHVWMKEFFERGSNDDPNQRGTAKELNRLSRHYSKQLHDRFQCTSFIEWMTIVMNYNAPMRDDPEYENLVGKWNDTGPLYVYWEEFLRTKVLPKNDRQDRKMAGECPSGYATSHYPTTVSSRPISARDTIVPEGTPIVGHTPI